jgi:hypothetical protein
MKTANLFQKEQDNVDYNACVGNNGWININTYIHGYQAATLVMLESVLKSVNCRKDVPENANYWYVDTAIYPILFSARHYIELYLKQKVYAINQFKINKKIEDKLVRTHDINKLWGLLKTIVNETHDSRISEFIIAIEPYVNDFSKIDLTGETFRYPYNQDYTKKHLENMSVIGLYNFYHKFNKLSKYMTDFDCLIDYLYDEYKTHTYTSHLNREDIENIAKKLPVHTDWKKDEFRKIKVKIKNQFKIGSKELSQVIDIIKEHMEFKRYIFPNIYELEIDKDKLINFINNKFSIDDLESFRNEEVSCIRTLVELGTSIDNGRYYSEDYNILYEKYLNEIKKDCYQRESNYEYSIRNINKIKRGLEKICYSFIYKINN